MALRKSIQKAICICGDCEIQYSKKEWEHSNKCKECGKSLWLQTDAFGEEYPVELVYASELKIGDYICMGDIYFEIINIQNDKYKNGNLYISALGYGSDTYKLDAQVWRVIL